MDVDDRLNINTCVARKYRRRDFEEKNGTLNNTKTRKKWLKRTCQTIQTNVTFCLKRSQSAVDNSFSQCG